MCLLSFSDAFDVPLFSHGRGLEYEVLFRVGMCLCAILLFMRVIIIIIKSERRSSKAGRVLCAAIHLTLHGRPRIFDDGFPLTPRGNQHRVVSLT